MKLFSIREQQIEDNPHLEDLIWPERNPELDRLKLGVYVITERHDNWDILIWYAQRGIDEIEYDATKIPHADRNLVNKLYIGQPKPKYSNESNCISKNK